MSLKISSTEYPFSTYAEVQSSLNKIDQLIQSSDDAVYIKTLGDIRSALYIKLHALNPSSPQGDTIKTTTTVVFKPPTNLKPYVLGTNLHKYIDNLAKQCTHSGSVPDEKIVNALGMNVPADSSIDLYITKELMNKNLSWKTCYELIKKKFDQSCLPHVCSIC